MSLLQIQSRAAVPSLAQVQKEGQRAKEGDTHLLRQTPPPFRREEVGALAAVRTQEATHVLDQPEHGQRQFLTESDLTPHIVQRHELRSADNHRASPLRRPCPLHRRDVLVARAGGRVHQQEVQLPPGDLCQQLTHHGRFLGSAPHDRVVVSFQEEPDGHGEQGGGAWRPHGQPPCPVLQHLRSLDPEQSGDGRTAEIYVEYADLVSVRGELERQEGGEGALAHAPLAG